MYNANGKNSNRGTKFISLVILAIFILKFCVFTVAYADEAEQRTIKVGYYDFDGLFSVDENGNYSGYNYEYLQKISEYTGWKYEFVHGTWNECLSMLEKGEIDILGLLQKTDEREKIYDFTHKECWVSYATLYVSDDSTIAYDDFSSFDGLKVGMMNGNVTSERFIQYQKDHNFSVQTILYNTEAELANDLEKNKIDAILSSDLRKTSGEKIVAKFYPTPRFFAVSKGNSEILSELNDALLKITGSDPYFNLNLHQKYFFNTKANYSAFSAEELEYVKNNKIIKTVYDPNWYPIEYYDESNKKFSGTTQKIFEYISQYSGLNFEFIKTDNFLKSYDMIQEGKADLLSGIISNESYIDGMRLTDSYYDNPLVFIGKKDTVINDDTIIALPENYIGTKKIISSLYPNAKIKVYKTSENCLDAVSKQPNMVTVENSYISSGILLSNYYNLGIISVTKESCSVRACLSNNADPILLSILNKAIAQITDEQKNQIMISARSQLAYKLPFKVIFKIYSAYILLFLFLSFVLVVAYILYSKKKRETELKKIAYTDHLTGGGNYTKFKLDAQKLFNKNIQTDYSIIHINIDKFKYINEVFGYSEGNNTLKYLYYTLNNSLESDELCSRISADWFVLLIKCTDHNLIVNRINKIFEQLKRFEIFGVEHYELIISCGIYVITNDLNDLNIMIDRASTSRETIQGNHKSSYAFYTNNIQEKIINEKEIENHMLFALANNEFVVYMQPKYHISSRQIVGAEALVRWNNPHKGLMYPGEFIPFFEKNGFIVALDFYMFETVCKQIRKWLDNGYEQIPISVNISRINLYQNNFVSSYEEVIKRYEIPSGLLELELTESAIFENLESLVDIVSSFKKIGVQFSIDDFGSGYSCLDMLKDIHADTLKIDRNFLTGNFESSRGKIVVKKIVELAKMLDIQVVTEGVENHKQEEFLKEIGCDIAQGFLFAKPMPMDEFNNLVFGNDKAF